MAHPDHISRSGPSTRPLLRAARTIWRPHPTSQCRVGGAARAIRYVLELRARGVAKVPLAECATRRDRLNDSS